MNEKFTDERISAYLDDELSADERGAVERELADNADLRQAVDELRALRMGLQSLPRYRMETNIAERVLELAEREVLTRSGSDEDASVAENDGRPQPVRRSSAPSASREATFSWRNLAWSATAAGVAALLTNYYHVSNRADERADNAVASAGDTAEQSQEKAAKRTDAPKGPASSSAAGGINAFRDERGMPADAGPDRGPMADALAADAPSAAERQEHAPAPPSDAGDGAAGDSRVDDSVADDSGVDAAAPDRAAHADRAMEKRAFGGERPGAAAADDVAAAAESLANPGGNASRGQAGGGQYRGRGFAESATSAAPVSMFVVHVTAEAMRRRAFDDVLSAHHVAMLDESRIGGGLARRRAFDGSAGGVAGEKADGAIENDGVPRDGALAQSALASDESPDGAIAEGVGPEVVEVDVTPEQLSKILAAVDRRAGEFSVLREFPLEVENALRDRFGEDRDGSAGGVAGGGRRALAEVRPSPDAPLKPLEKPRAAPQTVEVPTDKSVASPAPTVREKKSDAASRAVVPRAVTPRPDVPRASATAESSPGEGKDAERGDDEVRDAKIGERNQDDRQAKDDQAKDEANPPPATDAPSRDTAKGESNAAGRGDAKPLAEPTSPAGVAAADDQSPNGYARRVPPRWANSRSARRDVRSRSVAEPKAIVAPSVRAADADGDPTAKADDAKADDAAAEDVADRAVGGRSPSLADTLASPEAELPLADAPRIRVYFLLQPATAAVDAGSDEPPPASAD